MARLCERPDCSEDGAVAYGFDVDRTLVWLAPIDPDADRMRSGVLCRRHADSMVVPLGWSLDDRRDPRPKLFRPPRLRRPPRPKRPKKPARTAPAEAELPLEQPTKPSQTVAAITGVDGATAADPDATVATPWMPVFDIDDDLGGLLHADTPLLGRAFQGKPAQRR